MERVKGVLTASLLFFFWHGGALGAGPVAVAPGSTGQNEKEPSVYSGVFGGVLIDEYQGGGVRGGGPVAVAPGRTGLAVKEQPVAPVSFSLTIGTGYLTGESREQVYWPSYNNHKASELTWHIDSLFMIGIGGSLKIGERFMLSANTWFKATEGQGLMDDYDWLVPGGDWTDWSHHENTEITEGSIVDLNAQFAMFRREKVALNLIAGYKRDNFGWEARGGEYVYSEAGFRDTSGAIRGDIPAIGYEQTMTSLYCGLGLTAIFTNFQLDSRIIYSPLVQGKATDHHYLRNLVTYDEFENGDMLAFDISGSYHFDRNWALTMAFSYQKYDTMQGYSEWHFQDEDQVYSYPDGAGMDQTSSLLSLSLRYTF